MDERTLSGGGTIATLEELLLSIKLDPTLAVSRDLLCRKIAASAAGRIGIQVTEPEIDDAVAAFYSDRELMQDAALRDWLERMHLSEREIRRHAAETRLLEKLREKLVPDDRVERHFRASPYDYAVVHADVLTFRSHGEASEIVLSLKEREISWTEAVRRARDAAAMELHRREIPRAVASLLLAASPGDLIGPVESGEESHALYRLVSSKVPQLDRTLHEQIRDELFREEMEKELARDPPRFLR